MTILSKTERNMRDYGVGWFKFDEASGNVTDSKGTAVGTVSNITRVTGYNGQGSALNFNGTNGYVIFNLDINQIKNKFSIRFKFKIYTISSSQRLLCTGDSKLSSSSGGLIITIDNGLLKLYRGHSAGADLLIEHNNAIETNKWYDMLIIYDGTKISLIMNNLPPTSGFFSLPIHQNSIHLGTERNGGSWLNGAIDNLEIYNDVIYPRDKQIILSKDGLAISMKNNKIVEINNQDEQTFINHGIDGNTKIINTNTVYNEIENVLTQSQALGDGKVFTHNIDLNKFRGKKIKFHSN